VLTRDGEKHLVQCKQWRAFRVGVEVVRECYCVMAAKGAAGGLVVTSGRFTDEAVAFAQGRNVRLIDGPKLHGLIRQARPPTAPSSAVERDVPVIAPDAASRAASLLPSCPIRARAMKRGVARIGRNAGGEFWGCSDYRRCKGTRGDCAVQ
jgi:restriction system protein